MQTKIKLTFQRQYNAVRTNAIVNYCLTQLENAVTVKVGNERAWTIYRVGDMVPEEHVREFVGSKRQFDVKVKS